jgi:ribosomal protein S18 acetylase RimI-like enzyme
METSDSEPNKEENFQLKILSFENFENYKLDILHLEEQCFEPILRDNEQGLTDALKMKSALCFSMYHNDKMIGVYYLTSLDELNKTFFDTYLLSCWDPSVYKDYGKNNTYYIHIVAVSPDYQGMGIGKKLNDFTINYLKEKSNIKNILIHAHEGSMLNIIKKSGGAELEKLENLVNTGQDYYLCEINL